MIWKRSLFVPFIVVLVAFALSACGGRAGASQSPTPSTTETETPSTAAEALKPTATIVSVPSPLPSPTLAATATPDSPLPTGEPTIAHTPTASPFRGSRDPVAVELADAPPVATLVDVRVGRHEGFDRVVFEFQEALPGYRVEYIKPPILADGSGLPVEVAGQAFIGVRLYPAAAHNDEGQTTVDVRELTPGYPALVELEQTGDFEAVVNWALGLAQEVDFAVSEAQSPPRLIIDVAHP